MGHDLTNGVSVFPFFFTANDFTGDLHIKDDWLLHNLMSQVCGGDFVCVVGCLRQLDRIRKPCRNYFFYPNSFTFLKKGL